MTGFFFLACTNDVEEVTAVARPAGLPDEIMDTVYSVLTDMGEVTFTLRATRIEKYYTGEPRTWFPEGIEVTFYDTLNRKEAVITANTGLIYDVKQRIELDGNVVFKNMIEDQTLYTEQLIWEQRADSSLVYTDKPVKVIDKGDEFTGKKGIIADEKFRWYNINGFSANFAVPDSTRNKKNK
jgi:LPS export ABC transporter protein LptC